MSKYTFYDALPEIWYKNNKDVVTFTRMYVGWLVGCVIQKQRKKTN